MYDKKGNPMQLIFINSLTTNSLEPLNREISGIEIEKII